MKELLGSKTFYACLGVLGTALSGYLQGKFDLHAALVLAFAGLAAIFLRSAMHELAAKIPEAAPALDKVDVDKIASEIGARAAVAVEKHTGSPASLVLQGEFVGHARDLLAAALGSETPTPIVPTPLPPKAGAP